MRDEVRLLGLVIDATSADMDVAEVVQRVANLVTEATGSDVCFVHLLDEERQCVVLAGATPPFDEQIGKVELRLGQGIAGWVALHAEAAVVPDKWQDERYRYIPALRGEDYASMVSVPMLIPRGRRVIGVLNVHSKSPRDYGSYDLALLTQVANLMARAIENARLYQRLAEREEMLEGFATRTIEAQEHERRRLAGEIHDGISQRLISLWYHLLAAEDGAAGADPDLLRRELDVAKELVTAALEDARGAIVGLRPTTLDDLGLGPSLESLARSLPVKEITVDLEPVELPPHVEVALYRIVQEAFQNVVKHAGANRVELRLRHDADGVRLVVTDDGRGFAEAAAGDENRRHTYGLLGIQERAELIGAKVTVRSRPERGTTVELLLPSDRPSR